VQKKSDPFAKEKQAAKEKGLERERKVAEREEKERSNKQKEKKRRKTANNMKKRTRKGQVVMKSVIDNILEKLQK